MSTRHDSEVWPDAEPGVTRAEGAAEARRGRLYHWLTAAVALLGVADSVYLTAAHLAGTSVRCTVVTGCDKVLQSAYAELPGGVPVAALGALAYFTAFSLAVLAAYGYAHAATLLVAVVALMFAFTAWLFYLQAFVLGAFCIYCLVSAGLTTILAATQLARWFSLRRAR